MFYFVGTSPGYNDGDAYTFHAECLTARGVKTSAGVELRGVGGTLSADRYNPFAGYEFVPNTKLRGVPPEKVSAPATNAEMILPNWLECIRTRARPMVNENEGY